MHNSSLKEELSEIRQKILLLPDVSCLNNIDKNSTAAQLLDILLLEIEQLKERNAVLNGSKQTLYVKEIESVQEKLSSSEKNLSELQHSHSEIQEELNSVKKELQEEKQKESDLRSKCYQIEMELTNKLTQSDLRLKEIVHEKEQLKAENDSLKAAVEDSKTENLSFRNDNEKLTDLLQAKGKEISDLTQRNLDLDSQLARTVEKLESEEQEDSKSICIEPSKSELDATKSKLEESLIKRDLMLQKIHAKINEMTEVIEVSDHKRKVTWTSLFL
jgi:chromosome segregation ATPase